MVAPAAMRQHAGAPTSQLQAFHGARLRAAAPFAAAAAARPARRQVERGSSASQIQAVYVAEQHVGTRNGNRAAWEGPTARVTFKVRRQLPFGQVLKLVGSHPTMGEWDCSGAPVMTWSEGDVWLLQGDLPAGEHEYKLAAVAQGSAPAEDVVVEWEAGPNRMLQVPSAEAKKGGAFSIVLEWGNHSASWLEGQLAEGAQPHSNNGHSGDHHHNEGAAASSLPGQHHAWSMEDERNARRQVEAERDQLRGERDSLAHQLKHVQEQLAAALAEKAQLEVAAARAQHNIDVLRNVGQLLRTMHTD